MPEMLISSGFRSSEAFVFKNHIRKGVVILYQRGWIEYFY